MRSVRTWTGWCCIWAIAGLAFGCAAPGSPEPTTDPKAAGPGPVPRIEAYALEDQHGQPREVRFPIDRPLFLTLADRSGSRQVAGWVAPVQARFGDRIRIEGVADVRGVPTVLRGLIRSQFRRQLDYAIGLDWEGRVIDQTRYAGGQVEALVVDRQGRVVLRLAGPADDARLGTVLDAFDAMLER